MVDFLRQEQLTTEYGYVLSIETLYDLILL